MPLARAALSMAFNAGAISPTRREADLHQWSSHMSQTIMAVFSGFHVIRSVFTLAPAPALLWERKLSLMFSAQIEVVMAIRTLARIVFSKVLIYFSYWSIFQLPKIIKVSHQSFQTVCCSLERSTASYFTPLQASSERFEYGSSKQLRGTSPWPDFAAR